MKVEKIEFKMLINANNMIYRKYDMILSNKIVLKNVFLEPRAENNKRLRMTRETFNETIESVYRAICFCIKIKMTREIKDNFDNYVNICNYFKNRSNYHYVIARYNEKLKNTAEVAAYIKNLPHVKKKENAYEETDI
ncbi:hypothetical protein [Pantoea agglomerans]|uniref:hypothetical protein n=1 Tax=Enterobacter agglomerans TaxID=549 RepID=UPI000E038729|nr:hypothetical protein [Pantoea agglomerans]SUC48987.1 Uncharacterised protein [Pantoea agglomerans]